MDKPKKPTPFGPDVNPDDYPGIAVGVPVEVPGIGQIKIGGYVGWGDYLSLEANIGGNRLQIFNQYTVPGSETIDTEDHSFSLQSETFRDILSMETHGEAAGELSHEQLNLVFRESDTDTSIVIHNTTDASNGYSLDSDGRLINNARRWTGEDQDVLPGTDDGVLSMGQLLDDAMASGSAEGTVHADVMSVMQEGSEDIVFVRFAEEPGDRAVIGGHLGEGDYREIVYRDDGTAVIQDFTGAHDGVAEPIGPAEEVSIDTPDSGEGSGDDSRRRGASSDSPAESESIVSPKQEADTWEDHFADVAASDDTDFTIAPIEDVVAALPDGTNDNGILTLDEHLAALPSDGDVDSDASIVSMPSAEDNLAIYGFPMDEAGAGDDGFEIVTLDEALPDIGIEAGGSGSQPGIVGFEEALAGETPGFLDHPEIDAGDAGHDEPIFGAPDWTQPESPGVDAKQVAAAGVGSVIGTAGAMAGIDSEAGQAALGVGSSALSDAIANDGNLDLSASAGDYGTGWLSGELSSSLAESIGVSNDLAVAGLDYAAGAAIDASVDAAANGMSAGAETFSDAMSGGIALMNIAGGLAGAALADSVGPDAENSSGAMMGTVGSVAGTAAGAAAGAAMGKAIGGAIGSIVPVIGTAIGSAIGSAIGTALGNALGSSSPPPPPPEAWVEVGFNAYDNLTVTDWATNSQETDYTGPLELASAAADYVDQLAERIGGQWLEPDALEGLAVGFDGEGLYVGFPENWRDFGTDSGDDYEGRAAQDPGLVYVDNGQEALNVAVTQLLDRTPIEGGNEALKRILAHNDFETLEEIEAALSVAELYSTREQAAQALERLEAEPRIAAELEAFDAGEIEIGELSEYAAAALGARATLEELDAPEMTGASSPAVVLGLEADTVTGWAQELGIDEPHAHDRVSRLGLAMEEQGAEALAEAALEDLILERHPGGDLTIATASGPEVTIDWMAQDPAAAMLYLDDGTSEPIADLLARFEIEVGDGPVSIGEALMADHDVETLRMANDSEGHELVADSDADTLLLGNEGDDTLLGGGGDDVFISGGGENIIDGGEGENTVDYRGADGPIQVDLTAGTATGAVNDDLTRIQHVRGAREAENVLLGSDEDNRLEGGLGDDVLVAGSGDNVLVGVDGNNLLVGGDGADRLYGGDGNDELIAGDGGGDFLDGGDGNNVLWAGDGAAGDHLVGGAGSDVLHGGAGDDILRTAGDTDRVFAHEGDNTLIAGADSSYFHLGAGDDRVIGGAGDETVIVQGERADFDITATGTGIQLTDTTGALGDNRLEGIDRVEFADTTLTSDELSDAAAENPSGFFDDAARGSDDTSESRESARAEDARLDPWVMGEDDDLRDGQGRPGGQAPVSMAHAAALGVAVAVISENATADSLADWRWEGRGAGPAMPPPSDGNTIDAADHVPLAVTVDVGDGSTDLIIETPDSGAEVIELGGRERTAARVIDAQETGEPVVPVDWTLNAHDDTVRLRMGEAEAADGDGSGNAAESADASASGDQGQESESNPRENPVIMVYPVEFEAGLLDLDAIEGIRVILGGLPVDGVVGADRSLAQQLDSGVFELTPGDLAGTSIYTTMPIRQDEALHARDVDVAVAVETDQGVELTPAVEGIDRLWGGGGDDRFHLADDEVLVDAGGGYNAAFLDGSDSVVFNAGAIPGLDEIHAGSGDNVIVRGGGAEGQKLVAGDGENQLLDVSGADPGSRNILVLDGESFSDGEAALTDRISGGRGHDTLRIDGSEGVEVDMTRGGARAVDRVEGTSGNDHIVIGSGDDWGQTHVDTRGGDYNVVEIAGDIWDYDFEIFPDAADLSAATADADDENWAIVRERDGDREVEIRADEIHFTESDRAVLTEGGNAPLVGDLGLLASIPERSRFHLDPEEILDPAHVRSIDGGKLEIANIEATDPAVANMDVYAQEEGLEIEFPHNAHENLQNREGFTTETAIAIQDNGGTSFLPAELDVQWVNLPPSLFSHVVIDARAPLIGYDYRENSANRSKPSPKRELTIEGRIIGEDREDTGGRPDVDGGLLTYSSSGDAVFSGVGIGNLEFDDFSWNGIAEDGTYSLSVITLGWGRFLWGVPYEITDSDGVTTTFTGDASFEAGDGTYGYVMAADVDAAGIGYLGRDEADLEAPIAGSNQVQSAPWVMDGTALIGFGDPELGEVDGYGDFVSLSAGASGGTRADGLNLAFDGDDSGQLIDDSHEFWSALGFWIDEGDPGDLVDAGFVSMEQAGVESLNLDTGGPVRIENDVIEFRRGEINWESGETTEFADSALLTRPLDEDLQDIQRAAEGAEPEWTRRDLHKVLGNDWEVGGEAFDLQEWAHVDADQVLDGQLLEQAQKLADILAQPLPEDEADDPVIAEAELFAIAHTLQEHEASTANP